MFSARSSWSDVGEIVAVGREQVSATTKLGKEIKGKLSAYTADSVKIDGRLIAKADIRAVDYLLYKPLISQQEYLVHEQASWLDARLWFNRWLVPIIRVRVFDDQLTEDDTPICP